MMKAWASIPLRIALGAVFISHALQHLFGFFGGIGIFAYSRYLADLGFRPGMSWAYGIAYAELLAGIGILAGLCARIFSALMFLVILGEVIKVEFAHGFFLAVGGYEYSLVLLAVCSALLIQGGGPFSLTAEL